MNRLMTQIIVASLLMMVHTVAYSFAPSMSDARLKDLEFDEQGYLTNTSSDGFAVFDGFNISRDQACGLSLSLSFKKALSRPVLFDVYWRTARLGFSEAQKGFFLINQTDTRTPTTFIVHLCKLYNFSGNLNQPLHQENLTALRLDFPPNKNLSIKIDSIELLDSASIPQLSSEQIKMVEPYERIPARSFTSFDVVLPKLTLIFEHGLQRLAGDLVFLIIWLLSIVLLTSIILRSFIRQYRRVERD